jgi:hypothetical protein
MLIFNLLLLLALYYFYYKVIKVDLHNSIFSFLLIYQGAWLAASIVFVEATEIYLSEINRYAYFVYSLPVFIIFNVSSIYTVNQGIKFFERRTLILIPKLGLVQDQLKALKGIYVLVLFCLYLNLFLSPIPFFVAGEVEGIYSRFDFWENAMIPSLKIFGSIAGFLGIICGIVFSESKKLGVVMFVFYVAYVVLLGHKFGTLIMLSFFFVLPYIIANPKFRISFSKTNISLVICSILAVLLITLQSYSKYNPYGKVENIDTPLIALLYRGFALQSQLFWVSVEQNVFIGEPQDFEINDLYHGMINLMNKYHTFGGFEIDYSGATLTNGYPAILLETLIFPLAVIVNIFFSLIFAFIGFVVKACINMKNYFLYILFYFVFIGFNNLLTMGNGKIGLKAVLITLPVLAFMGYRQKRNNDR